MVDANNEIKIAQKPAADGTAVADEIFKLGELQNLTPTTDKKLRAALANAKTESGIDYIKIADKFGNIAEKFSAIKKLPDDISAEDFLTACNDVVKGTASEVSKRVFNSKGGMELVSFATGIPQVAIPKELMDVYNAAKKYAADAGRVWDGASYVPNVAISTGDLALSAAGDALATGLDLWPFRNGFSKETAQHIGLVYAVARYEEGENKIANRDKDLGSKIEAGIDIWGGEIWHWLCHNIPLVPQVLTFVFEHTSIGQWIGGAIGHKSDGKIDAFKGDWGGAWDQAGKDVETVANTDLPKKTLAERQKEILEAKARGDAAKWLDGMTVDGKDVSGFSRVVAKDGAIIMTTDGKFQMLRSNVEDGMPLLSDLPTGADTPWTRLGTRIVHTAGKTGEVGKALIKPVYNVDKGELNVAPQDQAWWLEMSLAGSGLAGIVRGTWRRTAGGEGAARRAEVLNERADRVAAEANAAEQQARDAKNAADKAEKEAAAKRKAGDQRAAKEAADEAARERAAEKEARERAERLKKTASETKINAAEQENIARSRGANYDTHGEFTPRAKMEPGVKGGQNVKLGTARTVNTAFLNSGIGKSYNPLDRMWNRLNPWKGQLGMGQWLGDNTFGRVADEIGYQGARFGRWANGLRTGVAGAAPAGPQAASLIGQQINLGGPAPAGGNGVRQPVSPAAAATSPAGEPVIDAHFEEVQPPPKALPAPAAAATHVPRLGKQINLSGPAATASAPHAPVAPASGPATTASAAPHSAGNGTPTAAAVKTAPTLTAPQTPLQLASPDKIPPHPGQAALDAKNAQAAAEPKPAPAATPAPAAPAAEPPAASPAPGSGAGGAGSGHKVANYLISPAPTVPADGGKPTFFREGANMRVLHPEAAGHGPVETSGAARTTLGVASIDGALTPLGKAHAAGIVPANDGPALANAPAAPHTINSGAPNKIPPAANDRVPVSPELASGASRGSTAVEAPGKISVGSVANNVLGVVSLASAVDTAKKANQAYAKGDSAGGNIEVSKTLVNTAQGAPAIETGLRLAGAVKAGQMGKMAVAAAEAGSKASVALIPVASIVANISAQHSKELDIENAKTFGINKVTTADKEWATKLENKWTPEQIAEARAKEQNKMVQDLCKMASEYQGDPAAIKDVYLQDLVRVVRAEKAGAKHFFYETKTPGIDGVAAQMLGFYGKDSLYYGIKGISAVSEEKYNEWKGLSPEYGIEGQGAWQRVGKATEVKWQAATMYLADPTRGRANLGRASVDFHMQGDIDTLVANNVSVQDPALARLIAMKKMINEGKGDVFTDTVAGYEQKGFNFHGGALGHLFGKALTIKELYEAELKTYHSKREGTLDTAVEIDAALTKAAALGSLAPDALRNDAGIQRLLKLREIIQHKGRDAMINEGSLTEGGKSEPAYLLYTRAYNGFVSAGGSSAEILTKAGLDQAASSQAKPLLTSDDISNGIKTVQQQATNAFKSLGDIMSGHEDLAMRAKMAMRPGTTKTVGLTTLNLGIATGNPIFAAMGAALAIAPTPTPMPTQQVAKTKTIENRA